MNFSEASQRESPGGSGKTYRSLGVFMFASPLTATFFNDATGQSSRGFWIEAFGIFAFGAYWILKTIECIRQSNALCCWAAFSVALE